ncbi:Golgi transport complex subunit 3 [Tulasnella sp. 424]|nr:Golgi transport complex subunit 3 [Tulasnella sp. 424]KAG8977405.1 Golgi transport complex subunit 3 [Tulasnella sp. 425]
MRRQQPHPIQLPPVKPQLTIEEWEAKAPLTDVELGSVRDIKAACEARRLPAKFHQFADAVESISRPSTPVTRNTASPTGETPSSRPQHPLHPAHPIATPQDFHDWFALIDKSISHSQEAHFRAHLNTLSGYLNTCDTLIDQANEVDEDVSRMMQDWTGVEEGGQSLQGACERMLEERDRLIRVTDEIEERLEYFQELEYATRMLNHPGDGLVLQEDFLFMVERVDVCIEYLESHRDFKESQLYLMRYQHCLTRAMTLIKIHCVNSLKALASEIHRRLTSSEVSSATQTLLLYPKFQSAAKALRPLITELEARAVRRPDDLSALLNECHAAYFSSRKQLITSRLIEEIQRIIRGSEVQGIGKGAGPTIDLVGLARAGCSYLKQLCSDEFNLYRHFFDSGEDKLYRFLEGLCDYLYDDLRPRILHEPKLAVLCQVCTVIQALMVLDLSGDYDEFEPSTQPDEDRLRPQDIFQSPLSPSLRDLKSAHSDPGLRSDLARNIRAQKHQQLKHLHIGNLLEMVLQDAQTRLVFKAQAVIQSEIRYYVAKEGDLDYPQHLIDFRKTGSEAASIPPSPSENPLSRMTSLSRQSTWYPTVKKTHWVLSQLHDYVKPAIFEDIAYEAISLCRESLMSASDLISAKSKSATALQPNSPDGQLFLIRHLLILKEMATAVGLDAQKERGMDFSGMADTLNSIIFHPNALLGQGLTNLRFPKVVESITDARLELDAALKRVCEEAISQCVQTATAPIQSFLSSAVDPTAASTSKAHSEFIEGCKKTIPEWTEKLRLYLDDDERTVSVLLPPMHDKVVEAYETFRIRVSTSKGGQSVEGVLLSRNALEEFLRSL